MYLTGKFNRSLDEKQRIAIPKTLREALGSQAGGSLFIAPGTDRSLAIYPEEAFAQLADRLSHASPTVREVRDFRRLLFSQAIGGKLDKQGRLRIPTELASWADLASEIVLLGVQDHMELWNRTDWEKYVAERQDHFDQISEAAFGQLGT